MPGTLYNGIYGYGKYGTAQYGIGGVLLDAEIYSINDNVTRVRDVFRSISESFILNDIINVRVDKPEYTKIFINGNIINGGIPQLIILSQNMKGFATSEIPIISNIMNSPPSIKNVTNGAPIIIKSLPYGY